MHLLCRALVMYNTLASVGNLRDELNEAGDFDWVHASRKLNDTHLLYQQASSRSPVTPLGIRGS